MRDITTSRIQSLFWLCVTFRVIKNHQYIRPFYYSFCMRLVQAGKRISLSLLSDSNDWEFVLHVSDQSTNTECCSLILYGGDLSQRVTLSYWGPEPSFISCEKRTVSLSSIPRISGIPAKKGISRLPSAISIDPFYNQFETHSRSIARCVGRIAECFLLSGL